MADYDPTKLKYSTCYYWRAVEVTGTEEESCTIGRATQEDIDHNGDNFASGREEFETFCSETLRDAIINAHYWPAAIEFDSTMSKEELTEAAGIINELVHDEKFCNRFAGKTAYSADMAFTVDNIIVHRKNSNDIPAPVEDNTSDYGDSTKELGDD